MLSLLCLILAHQPDPLELACDTVDQIRALHGLPAIVRDLSLDSAAQGQADYMAANKLVSHTQDPKLPKATKAKLEDRVKDAGYDGPTWELLGYSSSSVVDSVVAIFASPYHRTAFLTPGEVRAGVGVRSNYVCLLFGEGPKNQIILSPPDRAAAIPVNWLGGSGFEPAKGPYGYPVVARLGAPEEMLDSATITLARQSQPIDIIIQRGSDSGMLKGCLVAVPRAPLKKNSTYNASLSIRLKSGQSRTIDWSFSTEH
ncbi:MAG: CAP domain-containing protein [Fimbriimonadaceae bacterium]|nr:CAP domain-containing protein [Fimbriimonadaceae bacterium]QYK55673.1 MAG: CAP domain-containing protein [Fimbriimonadaceae bacterium]